MKTLIKTIGGENGKLYVITNERRILLAECRPKVEIYEHSKTIPILGASSCKVKSIHGGIVICAERETTRDVDADFLQSVLRFEVIGDFQRVDGVFERITFDSLTLREVYLDESRDWEFEIVGQTDTIRRLIAF